MIQSLHYTEIMTLKQRFLVCDSHNLKCRYLKLDQKKPLIDSGLTDLGYFIINIRNRFVQSSSDFQHVVRHSVQSRLVFQINLCRNVKVMSVADAEDNFVSQKWHENEIIRVGSANGNSADVFGM